MAIDGKDPSTWTESDLQELCGENRREGQRLEFKGELNLDREGEKQEAEHDAQGMAFGGGGVIVYGVSEIELPDGRRGAGRLSALTDGSLYERLRDVLDARGEPRLLFDLHPVDASPNGLYLVLDVAGRRRPHQAQDGRYYGRRRTSTRRLTEAEIAESYRERFLRDAQSIAPLIDERSTGELPDDVAKRIHRGLTAGELAIWREETGELEPPGWLSVVVYPEPRQRGLLDPIRDAPRFQSDIEIPEQWDPDHSPFAFYQLLPTLDGLYAQLPPSQDRPPAFLLSMFTDGVMEYGTTLEPGLRREAGGPNRIIYTASHTQQIHDYLQAFALALKLLGYDGPVAAQVRFENTRGVTVPVTPGRWQPSMHPIEVAQVFGNIWRGQRADLLNSAGLITKQVMDRVCLAAGATSGCWLVDAQGRWTGP
ncbi:MAG: hypothetical protein ACLQBB_15300 [Solirubrobacteraceae bacterium]